MRLRELLWTRRLGGAVFVFAFAARAVSNVAWPRGFFFPDSRRYHSVAANVVSGRGFRLDGTYEFAGLTGEAAGKDYRAHCQPGYVFFLAALYRIGVNSPLAVALVQALLDAVTALLAMKLTGLFFSRRAALIAGLVCALDPGSAFLSGTLLTETLCTVLLAGGVYLFSRWHLSERKRPGLAALFGGLLGMAALVRSALLAFLPGLLLAHALLRRREMKANARSYLLAFAVCAAVLAPWAVRNAAVLGAFVPGTTRLGIALFDGLGPGATGRSDLARPGWPAPRLEGLGEVERDRFLCRFVLGHASARPGRTAWLAVKKLARSWSPVPLAREFKNPLIWVASALSYLVLVGGAAWALRRHGGRMGELWPLLAPAVYLSMLSLVFVGSVRYRIPANFGLAVLAGAGIWNILERVLKPQGAAHASR